MILGRSRPLSCWLALLGLLAPACTPAPPEVVDDTQGSTSADASGSTTGSTTSDSGLDDTSTTTTVDPSTTSDTGPVPLCGDGFAEGDEQCDEADLAEGTCEGLDRGFTGGTLACNGDCTYDDAGCGFAPTEAPALALAFSQVKEFDFSWAAVPDATHYQLLESPEPMAPYVQLGGDIMAESSSIAMPLHFRYEASYVLRACNAFGCTDSDPVDVMGSLAAAVGYFKASNTGAGDGFGFAVAISGDGNTLAVGAPLEDSSATGIGGLQDAGANESGAVYVFVRDAVTNAWTQQAYVKASNTGGGDRFGRALALSHDGNTLAVGAELEDNIATGINGPDAAGANDSGAVYVYVRDAASSAWSQQAYVKASNTGAGDRFGYSVALSASGDTLAVGAWMEDSNATIIGGNGADNSAAEAGAAYVFVRNAADAWSQQAYIKASNTGAGDAFGWSLALSGDGNTLAVAAESEDGGSTGVNGAINEGAANSGAVYVFVRDGLGTWLQQAYVKASNTDAEDSFGFDVALSEDGNTLVVGAPNESSSATGIDGNQNDDSAVSAGAVYVLVRDGGGGWVQQAYVKASNAQASDVFGGTVALSHDGSTLVVGALSEDGSAPGLQGDEADDTLADAGAGYVLSRDGGGTWWQQAYVKAPNPGGNDSFAWGLALSGDAGTLVVGADWEDSNATGIGGDQANNAASNAGAVYLY